MNRDYLVIDLEATCDDGGLVPRREMEIIEIGAVLVDRTTGLPKQEFQSFIRPVQHPVLTAFCTELTSITDKMLAGAPNFPEAILALGEFIGNANPLFCSWGAYDLTQFRQDAEFHDVDLPLSADHLNLKEAFSQRLETKRRFGMRRALARVGIELTGTHHRGIDDAFRNASWFPVAERTLP